MRFVILILSITAFIAGCKKDDNLTNTNSSSPVFYIDLQNAFQHDSVRVSVDQTQVFADTITTSLILSLAKRVTPIVVNGSHSIKVELLNLNVSADTTINVSDTTTLAVNYVRSTKNISFTRYSFGLM
jgi:hypothetical protein